MAKSGGKRAGMGAGLSLALVVGAGQAAAQMPLWQGWDFSIEGSPSFLTSVPRTVFSQDITVTPNDITSNDRHLSPDFGGSIKAGIFQRYGEWDYGFAYRSTFSGRAADRSDIAVSTSVPSVRIPVYPGLLATPIGSVPILGLTATSEASSLMHVADVEVGHSMSAPWGELRLFGGLRFMNYSSSLHTRFSSQGIAEFDVSRGSRFWGIGPRFGAGVTVPVAPQWWFQAGASSSVLFGSRRTWENRGVSGLVPDTSQSDSNSGGRTAFGFDGELSLTHFMRSGWYLTFGYGAQSVIGINDTRRTNPLGVFLNGTDGATGTSAGSIVNHGPFIKLGFRPGVAGMGDNAPIDPRFVPKGTVAVEGRFFPLGPAHPGQRPQDISFWGELEFAFDLADRSRVVAKPFFRYDTSDDRRTHWDLREAYWQKEYADFRIRAGVARVFWGTLESAHLADVVNQVDLVENVDVSSLTEYRLGQPMVQLSLPRTWGTIDFFYLPYSRERTFPGYHGRLRSRIEVDTDNTQFDSNFRNWYPSFALRYSHSIGGLDFGGYYFHGVSRDPSFLIDTSQVLGNFLAGPVKVIPLYQVINQGGVDAIYTAGPWQFKFEGIVRQGFNDTTGRKRTYAALGAGLEYTFKSFFDTGADVGLLAEFLYDSRGRKATSVFENDVFFGVRVNLNDRDDTRAIFGYIQDVKDSDKIVYVGASRRIYDNLRLDIQARFFLNPSHDRILYDVRRDHFIQASLLYKF